MSTPLHPRLLHIASVIAAVFKSSFGVEIRRKKESMMWYSVQVTGGTHAFTFLLLLSLPIPIPLLLRLQYLQGGNDFQSSQRPLL